MTLIHPNILLVGRKVKIDYVLDSFVKPELFERNVNDFLTMSQFTVVYLRLMYNFFSHSYYYTDAARRFAARLNFDHNITAAVKYYILYYKKTFMMFLIFNTIIYFGFMLKVRA